MDDRNPKSDRHLSEAWSLGSVKFANQHAYFKLFLASFAIMIGAHKVFGVPIPFNLIPGQHGTTGVLTSGTSWAVPKGVVSVTIEVWGGGGGGGSADYGCSSSPGGGGAGGGGYVKHYISTSQISSFSYSIGSAGVRGATRNNGTAGGNTTVTYGTTTLTAGGGGGGGGSRNSFCFSYTNGAGGSGGSATGGNQANTVGSAGSGPSGLNGGAGGAAGAYATTGLGARMSAPGGGGDGGYSGNMGGGGSTGGVRFTW